MTTTVGSDRDAERAVLGAVLLSDKALPALIVDERLTPEHFTFDSHAHLFRAMLELHDLGAPIDTLSLSRKAGVDQGRVEELAASVPGSAGSARHYATLVKRAANRRRWLQAAELLREAAAHPEGESMVAQVEVLLSDPAASQDTFTVDRLQREVEEYFDLGRPTAITTGFPQLDDIIGGGFRPGDMTVTVGWENMGKTPLLHQWLALAAEQGKRTHVYINEMSARDLALRMLAHREAAPWSAISKRNLSDAQMARVLRQSSELPFEVTDASWWSADQIARHIRVNRWDLCGLDVLHNMDYQRESELRQIVTTLTRAARSSGAHLIVVGHLNQLRATDKILPKPRLRDIRDSGMISKAAATVLGFHRMQEEQGEFVVTGRFGTIEALKAKHGRTGDGIDIAFDFEQMRVRLPTGLELQSRGGPEW